MKLLNQRNGSVSTRTTFLVMLMVVVIMVPCGILQMNHVRDIIAEEVNHQANRSMDAAIQVIENRISNVETCVNTAVSYADVYSTDDHEVYSMLERLIDSDEDISAATMLYCADYFPEHGRYYAPTVVRDPVTNMVSADEIGGPENDFCYIETDSNWIYTNLLDEGYWCLPYVDSMSTKRAMVTYSVPLHDNYGKTYAVLCADVALDWVEQIVDEAKPYDYSSAIVLGRDSQYVCNPNREWIKTVNAIEHAQQLNDSDYLKLARRMLSGQRGTDTLLEDVTHLSSNNHKGKTIVYYASVPRVLLSVSYSLPEEKIMESPNRLRRYMFVLLLVMLILIGIAVDTIVRRQLRPMKMLERSTREIAQGHFDVPLPVIHTNDEIQLLRDSFEDMQSSLSHYVEELQTTTASKASIESELKVASEIQMSMLPKIFPPYPERDDIDIFGSLTPAKAVGGDLYDFFIRDEKLFFCIGDVSGKGVPAALVMAVTRSLFRTIASHEAMPERIVNQINDTLAEQNDSCMFVTLFVGALDLPTGRLRYCNAGHDAPLLVGDGIGFIPCDSNLPAGVMHGWKFSSQEILIYSKTIIFLYTDGLTEAENIVHEQFGEMRVKQMAHEVLEAQRQTPDCLIGDMTKAVQAFVGDAEQSDDLTMLAIKYTKEMRTESLHRSIVLPNDVQKVPELAQFVEEVCETVGFDMGTTMQMNLAMEEAVVNVMNYAYPVGTHGDIEVEAYANDVRLKFVITDSGVPFDPTAKAEVDTTLGAEERSIGGLGIHLIRQIMDSINYEHIDGKNILTLRKTLNKTTK